MNLHLTQPIFPLFSGQEELVMAKSDLEKSTDNKAKSVSGNMVRNAEKMVLERPANESRIHSGHFMVSRVHEDEVEDPDDDPDSPPEPEVKEEPIHLEDHGPGRVGYDFTKIAAKSPKATYEFGDKKVESFGIDSSLSKLFRLHDVGLQVRHTSFIVYSMIDVVNYKIDLDLLCFGSEKNSTGVNAEK